MRLPLQDPASIHTLPVSRRHIAATREVGRIVFFCALGVPHAMKPSGERSPGKGRGKATARALLWGHDRGWCTVCPLGCIATRNATDDPATMRYAAGRQSGCAIRRLGARCCTFNGCVEFFGHLFEIQADNPLACCSGLKRALGTPPLLDGLPMVRQRGRENPLVHQVGLEQSLDHLDQTFLAHGPFDGVLGFSQGGCLAGLLAAMQPRRPAVVGFVCFCGMSVGLAEIMKFAGHLQVHDARSCNAKRQIWLTT